ncbi:MAG TPA: hypothetical protein ENN19_05395 [Chloroflexi bacterium]|mgnify:CR=1 FL=1|nr:hypothetical protein [Chloroflexota bacterium]
MTVSLQNVGEDELKGLDVNVYSLDTYAIMVMGTGALIPILKQGQEETRNFQVSAEMTGEIYVAFDGFRDGARFHWETPAISIQVDGQPAELVRLLVLSEPYAPLGEPITCEAHVRGLTKSENLVLEFWVETPSETFESPDKMGLGILEEGEEERRTFEITPEEEGIYILHAYLYQGARRIGHQTAYLSISL